MPDTSKGSLPSISRRAALFGLGLTGVRALVGCSSNSSNSSNNSSTTSANTSSEAKSANESSAQANGEDLRIVTLNTGQLETALAFGFLPVGLALAKATSRASEGVPDFVKEEFGGQFDLDSITIVGERTAPDVEKILTLEPDLILTNKRVDEAILKKLEAIAPVVLTNGGGENWKEDLRIMGEALGKEEVAASMLKEYEDKAADFAKKNSAHPTVSLLRNKGDEYVMHGNRSLAGIVARDCGFHRPASQDFEDEQHKAVSPENLDMLEADYMFYGFTKAGQALEESTFWKDLNVVKDGNAHAVDVEPWYLNASIVAANRVMADMQKPIG